MELDHLIYAVPDLEDAIAEFERRLGLAPHFGGRHPGLGTRNAILPLEGEVYVELMAIDPDSPAPEHPRPFGLDELETSRLVNWAVRSHAIEVDVAAARDRGFDPGLVIAMTRDEPSGETIHWQLSIRREPFGDGLIPFVIDWGASPHPSLSEDRTANRGAEQSRLMHFSATHPDPPAIHDALAAMGVELEIQLASTAELEARLEGPRGSLVLR